MNDILSALITLIAAATTGFIYSRFLKTGKQITQPKVTIDSESTRFTEATATDMEMSKTDYTKKLGYRIHAFFNSLQDNIQLIITSVSTHIEPDEQLRSWRMFGYLFQLFFLALFAYADIIQVVNNLSLTLPQDVPNVPSWLTNLTFSLLLSSVGVPIAAGFILAEFAEITRFGKWNELKGNFRKIVYGLVWFSLISVLVIDAILAISRITSIPGVAQALSPEVQLQLTLADLPQFLCPSGMRVKAG
jgi:hypothetical protein